jgi:actin
MMKDLSKRGYSFTTAAVRVIARHVKQGLCYIALDFDTELETASVNSDEEKTHELPDKRLRSHFGSGA